MVKRQLAFLTIALIGLLAVEAAVGQTLFYSKDMAFAQVAAGGGVIESVMNITNRGSSLYSGDLYFRRGDNLIWNPTVNGSPITQGVMPVSVPPGSTVTYRVTDNELNAGFAMLYATSLNFSSLLEGNLTYYIKSGQTIMDSVGIAPSQELYQTSIPFDNFSTIALALANLSSSRTAVVTCTLFDAAGFMTAVEQVVLSPQMHTAQFLHEIFNVTGAQGGKVELDSSIPFIGTGCTLVAGELSSLPLQPSPVSYTMSGDVGTDTFTGQAVIWVAGEFVRGYMTFTRFSGQNVNTTYPIAGRLVSGEMKLGFYGNGPVLGNQDAVAYVNIPDFSFSDSHVEAQFSTLVTGDNYSPSGVINLTKLTH